MDSKSLHNVLKRMLGTVAWDKHGDHEYVVIGDGITIYASRLQQLIDATFSDPLVFLSFDRRRGFPTPRHEAAAEIAKHLTPYQDAIVVDANLQIFLEIKSFNHVARTGFRSRR